MRISPNQYFQESENPPQYQQGYTNQSLLLDPNHTFCFIIIGIVAGVALGLAIASLSKK